MLPAMRARVMLGKRRVAILGYGLLLSALAASQAHAQSLTPRGYWPAPEGTRIVALGFSHTDGDTIPDPSLPITGIDSSIDTGSVALRQTFALMGRTATGIVQQTYSAGETTADVDGLGEVGRDYQGMGDLRGTLTVNLVGAPSMDREQFLALVAEPEPLLGASLKVVAPTGRYDPQRLINVGTNRWAVKAEVGAILPLHPRWLWELQAGVWGFSDNDDFLGRRRQQEPIYDYAMHLVHILPRGLWVSLYANFYEGGRGQLDERKLDNVQRDSQVGATIVYPFRRRHAIKLSYAIGSLQDSDEDFSTLSLSYSRSF